MDNNNELLISKLNKAIEYSNLNIGVTKQVDLSKAVFEVMNPLEELTLNEIIERIIKGLLNDKFYIISKLKVSDNKINCIYSYLTDDKNPSQLKISKYFEKNGEKFKLLKEYSNDINAEIIDISKNNDNSQINEKKYNYIDIIKAVLLVLVFLYFSLNFTINSFNFISNKSNNNIVNNNSGNLNYASQSPDIILKDFDGNNNEGILNFGLGKTKIYHSEDYEKSKGLNFKFEYPIEWKVNEGKRPNVVSTISSSMDKNGNQISMLIGHEENVENISNNDLVESINSNVIQPIEGMEYINGGIVTIERQPFVWYLYEIKSVERSGKVIEGYHLFYKTIYKDKLLHFQFSGLTVGGSKNEIKSIFYSNIKLFTLIMNSIILNDKYTGTTNIVENQIENNNYVNSEIREDIRIEQEKLNKNIDLNNHFSYSNGNYQGYLNIKGFVEISSMKEPFCEENCNIYKYLYFNILDTDNELFYKYINEFKGGPFIGNNKIGIGCLSESNTITYYNQSDESGLKEYYLNSKISENIINSKNNSPITISINKPLLTSGMGAPACYSDFQIIGE